MSNLREFANVVLNKLVSIVGDTIKLELREVDKNNGVKLVGISFLEEGSCIAPTIYMEPYFERYTGGEVLEDIVNDILRCYSNASVEIPYTDALIGAVRDWETAKECLNMKIVNAKANSSLLKEVPHRQLLDLAVIYTINKENASITVKKEMMEKWGVTEDDLYQTASRDRARIQPMDDLLARLMGAELSFTSFGSTIEEFVPKESPMPLFVVTNEKGVNGFSEVVKPQNLKRIAEKLNSDLYVIPSSIHEGLIAPTSNDLDPMELKGIIGCVNTEQVEEQERLSDNLYFYNRAEDRLEYAPGSGNTAAA